MSDVMFVFYPAPLSSQGASVAQRRPEKRIQDKGVFDDSPGMLPEHPTAQELFDFVCRHFAEQGGPARNSAGDCVCRTPDGRSCAFGSVMTDEEAAIVDKSELDPFQMLRRDLRLARLRDCVGAHAELLEDLRMAHDDLLSVERLQDQLERIADQHNLKINIRVENWNA